MVNYFIKGYSLLISNWEIYLIGLLFNIILIIIPLAAKILPPLLSFSSLILSLVLLLLSTSFHFSIPLFFFRKQQHNQLKNSDLLNITIRNAKRLLVPFIAMFLISIVFVFLIFILSMVTGHNSTEVTDFISEISSGWSLSYFILMAFLGIILSIFNFIPIFFSIENDGFFTSFRKSFFFTLRNIKFLSVIILITLLTNFATAPLNLLIPNKLFVNLIRSTIFIFISYGVLVSSLIYYQALTYSSKGVSGYKNPALKTGF